MENAALSPAYTRSQWNSMVVPMPTAGPHTEAITGLGKAARRCRKRNTGESCVAGGCCRKSPMSLPALKMATSPWNTTTRTLASCSAAARASAMAAYIVVVMEFFLSTRLKVMVVTPASVWTRMSLVVSVMVKEVNEERSSARRCAHSL